MRGICQVALLLLLTVAGFAQQEAGAPNPYGEIRQALVIGNNKHPIQPLDNPVNDARAVADALIALKFDVTLRTDQRGAEMDREIARFVSSIQKDSVVIIYFAGHGVEFENQNYLIPIDLEANDEFDVERKAISVSSILRKLESSQARIRLLILDACRTNPYVKIRALGAGGLAKEDRVTGNYVAFATAPGKPAIDGDPGEKGDRAAGGAGTAASAGAVGHSVFTAELVRQLRNPIPGSSVDDVFTRVRQHVKARTGSKQIPYSETGLDGSWYPFGKVTLPEPEK